MYLLGNLKSAKINREKSYADSISCKNNISIVVMQYFEQDDPELYLTKIRYIEENDVNDMELVFAEEEYEGSSLVRVFISQSSILFYHCLK